MSGLRSFSPSLLFSPFLSLPPNSLLYFDMIGNTLAYGSDDGAVTVHADNDRVRFAYLFAFCCCYYHVYLRIHLHSTIIITVVTIINVVVAEWSLSNTNYR